MSSNPITSVPEPGASAAEKGNGDPLASVITQVQPGQAPAGAVRAGPTRPTKVSKASGAAGAKKKKKKRAEGESVEQTDVKQDSHAAGIAEGTEEETDAGHTAEGASAATAAAQAASSSAAANAVPQAEDVSHSHQASSTLVSTAGHAQQPSEPLSSAVGAGSGAADTAPVPLVNDKQELTAAAQSVAPGKAVEDNEKAQAASNDKSTTETAPAAKSDAKGKSKAQEVSKPKKSGLGRLIAILTCSSGAAGVVAAERDPSGSRRSREVASGTKGDAAGKGAKSKAKAGDGNGKLSPQAALGKPGSSRASSRRGSFERNTVGAATPGGGTKLPREETGDVMSGAVVPPGSSFVHRDGDDAASATPTPSKRGLAQREGDSDEEEEDEDEDDLAEYDEDEEHNEEQRLIMQGGVGIPRDEHGNECPLLGPIITEDDGRKCLVLDLDETLVHSSFKMIPNADFIVPVEIEGTVHSVYVIKRPGVDEFMRRMGEIYEVVVFTASLAKYADPVLDILDIHRVVRHRLFRESCYNHKGNYVKDLSQLGRDIGESIIIDNSPASYIFHPKNAVPISSWFNDPHDTELTDLCPFLADLSDVYDVRTVLDGAL